MKIILLLSGLLFVSTQVLANPPAPSQPVANETESAELVTPLGVLTDQLKILKLIVQTRRCYFKSPADADRAGELLDNVSAHLALLQGDKYYTEVAWFIAQIAHVVGNVGLDLHNGADITQTIIALGWAAGTSLAVQPRVPLPPEACLILMEAIYKDLAFALLLIPQIVPKQVD